MNTGKLDLKYTIVEICYSKPLDINDNDKHIMQQCMQNPTL